MVKEAVDEPGGSSGRRQPERRTEDGHESRRRPARRGLAADGLARAARQPRGLRGHQARVREAARAPRLRRRTRSAAPSRSVDSRGSASWSPTWTTSSTPHVIAPHARRARAARLRARADHRVLGHGPWPSSHRQRPGRGDPIHDDGRLHAAGPAAGPRLPFVYFNRTATASRPTPSRWTRDRACATLVEAVVELGHRRVGAIFGPRNTSTGEERESGAARRARRARHRASPARDVRHGPFDFETGHAWRHGRCSSRPTSRPRFSSAPTTSSRSAPSMPPRAAASTFPGTSRSSASTTCRPPAGRWSS